jgi:hypothetical protein
VNSVEAVFWSAGLQVMKIKVRVPQVSNNGFNCYYLVQINLIMCDSYHADNDDSGLPDKKATGNPTVPQGHETTDTDGSSKPQEILQAPVETVESDDEEDCHLRP